MANQLANELSPYLLQHADNPVNWRPWGEEALALAREEQKPIFLSIGYSSCHWCHVMAHESFENVEIARLLNEHFVSIKVDREERPDLDMIYMEAVQMISGRGGWPMSMFLTPEKEPFFGGTYWPVEARGGMAGFDQVLQAVADAWQHHRNDLVEQAAKLTQLLREETGGQAFLPAGRQTGMSAPLVPPVAPLSAAETAVLQEAAEAALRQLFDPQWGGFGPAPKFPQPLALRWLLRRWRRSGDDALLEMVTTTLNRMAAGGLFDQLGGGFHRYSVDAQWLIFPHFEKMLYDNAMLAACYLEAWQATGNEAYATIVRQTLDYLLRDMTDPLGGFYSSEDADSEGEEGKFYVWTPGQIEAVLGPDAAVEFCRTYGVTEAGNFEGQNILHLSPIKPRPVVAHLVAVAGAIPGATTGRGFTAEQQLLAARAKRIRPGRDEKVLVCWNSLAIDALARAGAALPEPRYTAAAEAGADFLLQHLANGKKGDRSNLPERLRGCFAQIGPVPFFPNGRLLHCWRAGRAKYNAYLDDYAGLGNALLTLYETTGSKTRLDQVLGVADEIMARFVDRQHSGFFYTATDHEPLIVRKKDAIDNPVPSGNGLAATLFVRLQAISPRAEYGAAVESTWRACSAWLRQAPTGTFQLLLAMEL